MKLLLGLALFLSVMGESYSQVRVVVVPQSSIRYSTVVRQPVVYYQAPAIHSYSPQQVPAPPEMPVQAHRPNRQWNRHSPISVVAYPGSTVEVDSNRTVQLGMLNVGRNHEDEDDDRRFPILGRIIGRR